MKPSVSLIAGVALVAVAAAAYFGQRLEWTSLRPKTEATHTATATPAEPSQATPVEVIKVVPTSVQMALQAVGTLRSQESVVLRPEVSGRIVAIHFKDGQAVRKGQLLVALDAALYEAEALKAQAELNLARANLKRTEDLARQAFVSGSAQDDAAANVHVLEANLQLAKARLARMRIAAPFDGVVGIRTVSVGDYVREADALVNLEDTRILKVDFRLPERDLGQVKVGQSVQISADALPGQVWQATLDAISPRVDDRGRSLELVARLDNHGGRLKPGMFVRVRAIVGTRAQAIMVPEESIVPLGDEFFVFKVVDGTARRIKVDTGVRQNARVEIIEGLEAGDQVVTLGVRLSRDGQPVHIVNEQNAAQP